MTNDSFDLFDLSVRRQSLSHIVCNQCIILTVYKAENRIMLIQIEEYLQDRLTQQRCGVFMEALKLIHSYEVTSPLESLREIVSLQDTYSKDEALGLIESIITNVLQEILAHQFIITTGDLKEQLELLKGVSILEHYLDSDVILNLYDEDRTPQEMLFIFLINVTTHPIEYFDSFVVDVRPTLIELIIEKHTDDYETEVVNQEQTINPDSLLQIKQFAEKYPNSLGVVNIKKGLIRLDMGIDVLIKMFQNDIYKLNKPKEIAEAIYSLVVVSSVEEIEVPATTMNLVNTLYDDLELIGELKYLVTSF